MFRFQVACIILVQYYNPGPKVIPRFTNVQVLDTPVRRLLHFLTAETLGHSLRSFREGRRGAVRPDTNKAISTAVFVLRRPCIFPRIAPRGPLLPSFLLKHKYNYNSAATIQCCESMMLRDVKTSLVLRGGGVHRPTKLGSRGGSFQHRAAARLDCGGRAAAS